MPSLNNPCKTEHIVVVMWKRKDYIVMFRVTTTFGTSFDIQHSSFLHSNIHIYCIYRKCKYHIMFSLAVYIHNAENNIDWGPTARRQTTFQTLFLWVILFQITHFFFFFLFLKTLSTLPAKPLWNWTFQTLALSGGHRNNQFIVRLFHTLTNSNYQNHLNDAVILQITIYM